MGYDLQSFSYFNYVQDDLYTFTKVNTHYALAMRDTANLIYSTLNTKEFISLADDFEKPAQLISFWTAKGWALFTFILVAIVAFLVLLLIVRHLKDKYPETLPRAQIVKIAIFGNEYESKSDSKIYVDIDKLGLDPFENMKSEDKNEKN